MAQILIKALDCCLGSVCLKLPSEHIHEGWKPMECITATVHPDKCLPRLDPLNKGLPVRKRQVPCGVGKNYPIEFL